MTSRSWQYYRSPNGAKVVSNEVEDAGLEEYESAKLVTLMDRIRDGRTRHGDVKSPGQGVLEARLSGRRQFRLLFAKVDDDGGVVLLGLHFVGKKSRTIPRAVETAQARLKDWLRRKGQ